jgi:hypothetical protein
MHSSPQRSLALIKSLVDGKFLSVEFRPRDDHTFPPEGMEGEALWEWLEENDYGDIVGQMYVRSVFPAPSGSSGFDPGARATGERQGTKRPGAK